jgi:aldose 1-epimerase
VKPLRGGFVLKTGSAVLILTAAALLMSGCAQKAQKKETPMSSSIAKAPFGKTADGASVDIYTLKNAAGMEAAITTYGGRIVSLKAPGRDGKFADVVLGFDNLEGYLGEHPYFGALVGRYGNRIAKGRFKLDGKEYKLAVNNGVNSLHGGLKGFDKVVWVGREVPGSDPSLELTYLSKDGEEGYPGNLTQKVTYTLTAANELKIDYSATTDKDTVLNVTNHSYFNLAGQGQGDILGHVLQLNAAKFTPVDAGLIPTGELKNVEGTPFDFRQPTVIGARIDAADEQIKRGGGYDHNFVVDGQPGTLRLAARVSERTSGRILEVSTTEPGVQFYTGNFLDGTVKGKGGVAYAKRTGFCLETQHFPDSPNHPDFPTTTLKPGAEYKSTTVFKFSVQ